MNETFNRLAIKKTGFPIHTIGFYEKSGCMSISEPLANQTAINIDKELNS